LAFEAESESEEEEEAAEEEEELDEELADLLRRCADSFSVATDLS